jgi:hypothetical protein
VPEKEWTLLMSGTTYLKVAEAASILGFESVEEMFFDYDIKINDFVPEGEVIQGKNVVLGDILEGQPAPRCDHPDHQRPIINPMIYPMPQPFTSTPTWPGSFTISSSSNITDEQRTAYNTIMTAGK